MTTFVFTALSLLVPGLIILSEIPVKTDTLKIVSSGTNNQVIIDSCQVSPGMLKNDSLSLSGQILQRGQNNNVEISTKREAPNNNKRITNSKKPETRNPKHVTITQTGKNNSIKINSK